MGPLFGRLAQLVRATGLHPVGHRFESCAAHHECMSFRACFFLAFFMAKRELVFGEGGILRLDGATIGLLGEGSLVEHVAGMLALHGALVRVCPMKKALPAFDKGVVADVFTELGMYDWGVFTDLISVQAFLSLFDRAFGDLRELGPMRIAAMGEDVAQALRLERIDVDVVAVAKALPDAMGEVLPLDHVRVVCITEEGEGKALIKDLLKARAIVDHLVTHRFEKADKLPASFKPTAWVAVGQAGVEAATKLKLQEVPLFSVWGLLSNDLKGQACDDVATLIRAIAR